MRTSAILAEKDALLNALSSNSIGIIIGQSQNIDTYGASLALYLSLKSSGKNVQIVSKRPTTVELSNLFGVNKIESSFTGSTKTLTISVPYREGEIEKVSYNIEADRLNVNLFAEENGITFNERDIQYIRKGSSPEVVFAVGASSLSEISDIVSDTASVQIVNIDNNPQNSFFGNIVLADPIFSSVSEIVAEIISELGFTLDPDISQNLFDGITYATRNFTNPQVSAYAFEAAGFLLMNGAQRKAQAQSRPFERVASVRPSSFPQEELLNRNQSRQQPVNAQDRLEQMVTKMRQDDNKPRINTQSIPSNNFDRSGFDRNEDFPPAGFNRNNNVAPTGFDRNKSVSASSFDRNKNVPPVDFDDNIDNTRDEFSSSSSQPQGTTTDVPDDWFMPKVFKGSKKRN